MIKRIAFLMVILLVLFVASPAMAGPRLEKRRALDVVFVGDSITAGADSIPYPAQYASMTGNKATNLGRPGSCLIRSGCFYDPWTSVINGVVAENSADVVVVGLGINDLMTTCGNMSVRTMRKGYRKIAASVRNAGSRVVFSTITPTPAQAHPLCDADTPKRMDSKRLSINKWLTKNYDTIDMSFAVSVRGRLAPKYAADEVHPNAAGYRRMAIQAVFDL